MMLLLQQSLYVSLQKLLIFSCFIRVSYQQQTTTTSKDLTFCIENHSLSNTLQIFWHDANADCELEPKRLIELYGQFVVSPSNAEEDQCAALLKLHIRRKLVNAMSEQLEEALMAKTLATNFELKQNLKQLLQMDRRVAQAIWERVVNEVYLFVAPKELINDIMLAKEEDLQIIALQCVLNKFLMDTQQCETLVPLLTFHFSRLYKKSVISATMQKSLQVLYNRLPKQLRLLYESSKQEIGLLNYQHSEYLYAPRDNGPDNERRLALTWSETKNSTDSDGHLVAAFDENGLVAFGNRYSSALKYLYADVAEQAAYFWIGAGLKASQWWQVISPHVAFGCDSGSGYIMFQNSITEELLCATTSYDENRRYVTLLSYAENMDNTNCYWLINRF